MSEQERGPFKMLRFQNAESCKALKAAEQLKDKSAGKQHFLKKHSREEKEKEKMVTVIHKYNHNVANYLQQHGASADGGQSPHTSSRQSSRSAQGDNESVYPYAHVNEEIQGPATHLTGRSPRLAEDEIDDETDENWQEKENAHHQPRAQRHHEDDGESAHAHGYPEDESEEAYPPSSSSRRSPAQPSSPQHPRLKSISKPPVPSTQDTLAADRERQKEKDTKKERDYVKSNAREVIAQFQTELHRIRRFRSRIRIRVHSAPHRLRPRARLSGRPQGGDGGRCGGRAGGCGRGEEPPAAGSEPSERGGAREDAGSAPGEF